MNGTITGSSSISNEQDVDSERHESVGSETERNDSGFAVAPPKDATLDNDGEMVIERTVSEKMRVKKRGKALNRMIFFPLILIVCYLPGTIRRILDAFDVTSPYWLAMTQTVLNALIGFFDALVYGLTRDVRKKDMEYLRKCCKRYCNDEEDDDE